MAGFLVVGGIATLIFVNVISFPEVEGAEAALRGSSTLPAEVIFEAATGEPFVSAGLVDMLSGAAVGVPIGGIAGYFGTAPTRKP